MKIINFSLDQKITPQKAKLGPDNNSTACIYIYIYIHTHIKKDQQDLTNRRPGHCTCPSLVVSPSAISCLSALSVWRCVQCLAWVQWCVRVSFLADMAWQPTSVRKSWGEGTIAWPTDDEPPSARFSWPSCSFTTTAQRMAICPVSAPVLSGWLDKTAELVALCDFHLLWARPANLLWPGPRANRSARNQRTLKWPRRKKKEREKQTRWTWTSAPKARMQKQLVRAWLWINWSTDLCTWIAAKHCMLKAYMSSRLTGGQCLDSLTAALRRTQKQQETLENKESSLLEQIEKTRHEMNQVQAEEQNITKELEEAKQQVADTLVDALLPSWPEMVTTNKLIEKTAGTFKQKLVAVPGFRVTPQLASVFGEVLNGFVQEAQQAAKTAAIPKDRAATSTIATSIAELRAAQIAMPPAPAPATDCPSLWRARKAECSSRALFQSNETSPRSLLRICVLQFDACV